MALHGILAGIGGKLGMDVVGKVLDKTLPKAADFLTKTTMAPFDAFENVMNLFGGKASKTPPAPAFKMMPPPTSEKLQKSGGLASKLKSLMNKMDSVTNILKSVTNIVTELEKLTGKGGPVQAFGSGSSVGQVPQMGVKDMVQYAGGNLPGSSTGSPGIPQPTGGPGGAGGALGDQWSMLQYMQQCQQASQMFELAVKVSEIQHQADVSAIRGIKY